MEKTKTKSAALWLKAGLSSFNTVFIASLISLDLLSDSEMCPTCHQNNIQLIYYGGQVITS